MSATISTNFDSRNFGHMVAIVLTVVSVARSFGQTSYTPQAVARAVRHPADERLREPNALASGAAMTEHSGRAPDASAFGSRISVAGKFSSASRLSIRPEAQRKEADLILEVLEPELVLRLQPARSKVMRTRRPVSRIAITDPSVVEVNEFSMTEIEVIGSKTGETTMTMWFDADDGAPAVLRYLVQVVEDEVHQRLRENRYARLQARVNELFPNSQVQLIPIRNKLIVRGQARDSSEAAKILEVLGREGQFGSRQNTAANRQAAANRGANGPGSDSAFGEIIIDLLHVPGVQQVMLKVRIAELTRSAARELGVDFEVSTDDLQLSHFIGGAGNITAILDEGDLSLFITAFSSNGYGKILAEPTLVTLSGQPATFLAGGEFAVPTVVGVDGVGAATTEFHGFGTELAFTPTVVDKDKIRLEVAPSFSTLNPQNSVNGIPGLNRRAVTTTVDLREGQWLAIAGLIQDEQGGRRNRLPYLGELPLIGQLFSTQRVSREETELVVLVSPELVHPLEPEQMPLYLPGMELTEPTDKLFFGQRQIEGSPDVHYRSTVWPAAYEQEKRRICLPTIDRSQPEYVESQEYYISGPQGFSK